MLKYIEGDIFNSPAQVIVNTVNTVGVMGKGIALEFKKRYPDMFASYRTACEKKKLLIGKLMLWYAPDHWILMFPTKEHWRNPSKIEYIEKGLMTFVRKYADYNISSIAFPKLGCGNGELDWNTVRPLMEKYLSPLPIDIYIYLGFKDPVIPEHKKIKEMDQWLKENAKDLSFNSIKDDIIYNSSITPIVFHQEDMEWRASWRNNDQLIFTNSEDVTYKIEEDKFMSIWDGIRNEGVFPLSPEKDVNLVYDLLTALEYLTEVRIKEDDTLKMVKGYQLDEGKGRYYSVKGN